jgi:hypothetical protein
VSRLTVKAINAALKARGREETLERGKGYFYFWNGDAPSWYTSSVPVYKLTQIPTVEGWLAEFDALLAAENKRRGLCNP